MASKYEYYYGDYLYCDRTGRYSERGYFEAYPTGFTRKTASTATVSIHVATELCRANVQWLREGRYIWQETLVDGNIAGRSTGQQVNNCTANWGNCLTHSGTYSFEQTSNNRTSLGINGRSGYEAAGGEINFYWSVENGWNNLTLTLDNNYKILPPTGLSGQILSKRHDRVVAKCTLSSWSANTNIKGTPYTGTGGKNWNFRAVLKNGSNVIKTLTTNTGETKEATFTFTGLNLPTDTTLTVEFTASNNYQQTVSTSVTFQVTHFGWIVTQGSAKKIRYIQIVAPIEDGGSVKEVTSIRKIT